MNFVFQALKTTVTKLLFAGFSQAFIEWLFFKLAELAVKCTNNTLDDEALAKLKQEYFKIQ